MEFIKLIISVILFLLSGLAGYNIYNLYKLYDAKKCNSVDCLTFWILSNAIVINMTAIYILWRI